MFERFSQRSRQVVVFAQQEARELGHDHIGTEHLLIAVLREEIGLVPAVLAAVALTADEARAEVVAIAGRGYEASPQMLPFTPRAQRALELGVSEALRAGRLEVQPEHVLLALLAESEGVAARILSDARTDAEAIRATIIEFSAERPGVPETERRGPLAEVPEVPEVPEVEIDFGWRGRPIALAALGAAVLARSAFDPSRTGMLMPIEMQLLVHLALAAREDEGAFIGEEIDSLPVALGCDRDDIRQAVWSLLRDGLAAGSVEADEDRLAITPAGVARVEQWLRRTVSLFGGWPPTIPGVDDT